MLRIIIVGASSGLGRGLAERYIKAGNIVGVSARNVAALEELKALAPERVYVEKIDITSGDAPVRLEHLISQTGGIDIYLHCSGIFRDEDSLEEKSQVSVVQTNVTGFVRMISWVYNYFKKNSGEEGNKQIAAISSIAGVRGLGELPAYSASKAFDSAYLEALRQKAHKERLHINITDIKPGWTRTPLLDKGRTYLLEMDSDRVTDEIFKAINKKRSVSVIGLRWKILTGVERIMPRWLWERLHLPLWK